MEGESGSQVINAEVNKSPNIKMKTSIQARRRSERAMNDDMMMQTKAEQAKTKLNQMTGMQLKPFTCLQNVNPNKLVEAATDSMVILGHNKDSMLNNISVMQAREMAQAAILATKRKIELEKQEKKEARKQMIESEKEKATDRRDANTDQEEEMEICSSPESETRDKIKKNPEGL